MEKGEKYRVFAVIIIIALVVTAIRLYWEEDLSGLLAVGCMIEYGRGQCIDGSLNIPFYNPNANDITSVRITVPSGVETDIELPADFNVREPLPSGETGVISLMSCERDIDMSPFSIEWCCGENCYSSKMRYTSSDVSLKEVGE